MLSNDLCLPNLCPPNAAKWCLAPAAGRWSPGSGLAERTTSKSFLLAPISNDPQAKLIVSQTQSVLPSDAASLVFLSEIGVGKGSREKIEVSFCGTTLSLPGTKMLNVVPLLCSSQGFDWFCLKAKHPAAPEESSSQTLQPLRCLLVLLKGCSKWRGISWQWENFLKPCAIYWSSRVNYIHDSLSKNCDLAFVVFIQIGLDGWTHP